MKAATVFSFLVISLLVCGKMVQAQDAAKVAPDKVKSVLDNDKVRVLEFTVKPGEKTGMHSHPDHILYSLTGGTMKTILSDGKTSETVTKAGDVRWIETVTHDNENIGKTEIRALVIELKTPVK
jgi:quercetin dioxygenase-like cupin family protein